MPRMQDILGLGDVKKNPTPIFYDHAIKHRTFDLELYNDLREMSPILERTLEEGESKLKTFTNLSEDMFMNLFKYNPEIREESEITPSRRFNYGLLKELSETEEFAKLRDMCKLNLLNSAIGTEVLHDKALVKINAIIEEKKRKQEEQNNNGNNNGNESSMQDILSMINAMVEQENQIKNDPNNQQQGQGQDAGQGQGQGQGGNPSNEQGQNGNNPGDIASDVSFGDGTGQESSAGKTRLTDEAAQKLAEMQQKMAESQGMKELKQEMEQALKSAAKEAQEDVRELDEFVNAWGLSSDDSSSRVSFDECKSALERIRRSDQLKLLTDILGRFRNIAKNNLKNKSQGEGQTLKNVTIGNDPGKILPSEKALLANSSSKRLFYKKFNEKQLLQYEVENSKRKGMGPMVVCLDVSGSMNDGKRDIWGRAVALALLEIAQRQKRNYALLMFNNKIAAQWIIPKGELKPDEVLDIAEKHFSGGTTFSVPVEKAIDIINKERNFRKGDIVFITDGDCSIPRDLESKFIQMKKDKNICIQTIVINVGGHCSLSGVEKWSDEVRLISKLADLGENMASDIFNTSIGG